jgi:hypothetical protein
MPSCSRIVSISPRAALVEQHDAIARWIEKAPVIRRQPRAGAAVQKDHR